jgi:mannosylglycerate hydrolase
LSEKNKDTIFIVPSTHWDREWYLPFQSFRTQLVHLIDKLLERLSKQEYFFMLDGQTIVLEDYFEIRPERKEELLKHIRNGKIDVGPWYLLPDEWLVGQESLVRNLEMSLDLAKELEIPLMNFGYLPDQFGHTRAIPQLLADLTSFDATLIWRGVGPEITTVPFIWKSHPKAKASILCNYMPFGYGNAAYLPDDLQELEEMIKQKVEDLKPFSPVNTYLLMNGTDHQLPQEHLIDLVPKIKIKDSKIKISLLNEYLQQLKDKIAKENYPAPIYSGEFRSSVRAPLLQDTYSARMWIKQWDNKIEDILVHYAEPIHAYLNLMKQLDYPESYLKLAWKWLLKNQPHDSICGCSVDQTHEEMKARFYWAEDIANNQIKEAIDHIYQKRENSKESFLLAFNPTNSSEIPNLIEFSVSAKHVIKALEDENGNEFNLQPVKSTERIIFESKMKPFMIRAGMKMLPGRKIMDFYINDIYVAEDSSDAKTCNVTIICGEEPIGEFNPADMADQVYELLDSKKYQQFHIKATTGTKQSYISVLPLKAWSFNKLKLKETKKLNTTLFLVNNKTIDNQFYKVTFNKNGTFDILDKKTNTIFEQQHCFEDFGDRGDEYTFGRLAPTNPKISKVKRKIVNNGPAFCDVQQDLVLETYFEVDKKREKRIGKAKIPVKTIFRFYRDISRIDVTTTLTNTAKDHRLRICFDMPFNSECTQTSTHFGVVKRKGSPPSYEEYLEQPSGIQAQKRFIRVDDVESHASFSLFNKGLPEVELADETRVALTLIRSTGYLSRMDYPERPIHAGPDLATPGAQELNEEYTFNYGVIYHEKEKPLTYTLDNSEVFALPAKCIAFEKAKPKIDLTQTLISVENPSIRISSLRIRQKKLHILFFNLDESEIDLELNISEKLSKYSEIKIDGEVKISGDISKGKFKLKFDPFEIKLLKFD